MDGLQALALAKKYTKDTSDSLGSLKGAPCRIKSIEQLEEGSKVTFEWEGKSGALETNYIILKNGPKGKDGVGISDISQSGSEELIDTYTITLSNDETYEFQVKNGKDGERGLSINGCSFNEKGELVITLENGVALPGIMLPSASVSISKETNNIISQRDDGLYVPKTNLEEYIKAKTVENTFVKKEEGKSLVSDEDIQSISESKTAIGDIKNIEVKSWTDIVTAINALYNSTVTKIECSGTKLKVTFADKEPEEVDVSSIISTSKLGDLQNVDDSEVTSGQVLAYDSESSKYKPKTFDLAAVLTQAKAYTDREITNSVKNHSIACDEKPVYNDGEKPTITYILNGITHETEATETWFFYHVDGDTFQTKWVNGVEFTIDALDTDFTQFVQKTDIANSYTGEEIDKTKIASLKALDDLAKNVSGLPEPEAKDKLLLVTENDSKLEWTQVDKDEVGGDSSIELTQAEYDELERKGEVKEDVTYYIKDLNPGEDKNFVKVIRLTSAEYELLSEEEKNDSTKLFAITDAESESFSQTKILAGKKCICFGDSITWYDGNAYNWGKEEGVIAKGYETYLRTSLGLNVTNAGMSGYTMPGIYETIKNYNFINYDYLTITGGCNDERHNTPVGTVSPIGSTFDTSTYIGALQAFIEKAIYQNPEIKIILITPIKGWIYPQDGWVYEGHPTDLVYETSEKYANAIKEVAKVYSLPVCDWFNTSGINLCTRNIYINDPEPPENTFYSLHPSTKGYKRMAEQLIPYFKNSVI